MNNETGNGEKFVFELKDLSYNDLISLYNDIVDFNTYLDETFKSVSEETIAPEEELKEEETPSENENASSESEEKPNEDNNTEQSASTEENKEEKA